MQYNANNPAVKRILKELKDMELRPSPYYVAHSIEDNLFDWHFTIRGPKETDFEGGRYHGRIILPPEYPFKPPSIMFLTPNGRFQLHTKICLSITGYHPEFWQPAWSVATVLTALISLFPAPSEGAIGGLNTPSSTRKTLAKRSHEWTCPICFQTLGKIVFVEDETVSQITEAEQELISLVAFKPDSKEAGTLPSASTSKMTVKSEATASPQSSHEPVTARCVHQRSSRLIDFFLALSLGLLAYLIYTK